jgi:hypothetical protein
MLNMRSKLSSLSSDLEEDSYQGADKHRLPPRNTLTVFGPHKAARSTNEQLRAVHIGPKSNCQRAISRGRIKTVKAAG